MVITIQFTTLMTTLLLRETNYSRCQSNKVKEYILIFFNKDGVPGLVKSLLLNKVQAVFPSWNYSLGLHNLYMSEELPQQTRWNIRQMQQRINRIMDTINLF